MAALLYGHPDTLITLNSAVSNIPTTYNNAAGSLIRNLTSQHPKRTSFTLLNYTDGAIAISLDNLTDNFVCPSGAGGVPSVILIEHLAIVQKLAIRSLTGSVISTGLIYLSCW